MPSARCCWRAVRKREYAARWKLWKKNRRAELVGVQFEPKLRLVLSAKLRPLKTSSSLASNSSMKIDVLTLFPAMFAGPLDESIVKRARTNGALDLTVHNLRDYTHDRHKTVDD